MVKKGFFIVLTAVFLICAVTGCKQNVGTPEDNAIVEETEEENEEGQTNRLFGFSCADLSDPFAGVLKDSVSLSLDEQGDRILVRDAQGDAAASEEQHELFAPARAVFDLEKQFHVGFWLRIYKFTKTRGISYFSAGFFSGFAARSVQRSRAKRRFARLFR